MTDLETKLIERAERVEERPDGRYVILSVGALSGEEFSELIKSEVARLQHDRLS